MSQFYHFYIQISRFFPIVPQARMKPVSPQEYYRLGSALGGALLFFNNI